MDSRGNERYKSLPPGVRNNNYLNIKKSANKWQGTRLHFTMPDPNSHHAKYLWIQLASAMTMVEIGKSYWEDFIYKYKGLQHIEKGFDMVFPPEE